MKKLSRIVLVIVMVIVEEYEEKINNTKLVELIALESYYELDFITEDWIIRRLYISKPQTTFQESITIMQLKLPQDVKDEILEKTKIENLKTKIYLIMIILDLNLLENNTEEAYHQKEDLSEIFYYKF